MNYRGSIVFVSGLIAMCSWVPASWAYYGRHSTEAVLKFKGVANVTYTSSATLKELNHVGPKRDAMIRKVQPQIDHLMGYFQSEAFLQTFPYPGVLGEEYEINFLKIKNTLIHNRIELTYEYSGKVVFEKSAFNKSKSRKIKILLPLAADLIYSQTYSQKDNVNHCTDEHYNTEVDFWYFWDTGFSKCPLQKHPEFLYEAQGTLKEIPNTLLSYPEYDLLYGDNNNKKSLEIAVFLGYIDDLNDLKHPHKSDDGRSALEFLTTDLLSRGFQSTLRLDAFREYLDGDHIKGINFLRRFKKQVKTDLGTVDVNVQLMLADTEIHSKDETFHRYLIPALKDADIVVYDGHSGLGGNLKIGDLPEFRFKKKSKYQLFYFNGCSSYPYFNGMYFEKKGGSKLLDIITSGLPTFSDSSGPNVLNFLKGFLDGKTWSYQTILNDIEESNGSNGTTITGVNGDEDNRFTAQY